MGELQTELKPTSGVEVKAAIEAMRSLNPPLGGSDVLNGHHAITTLVVFYGNVIEVAQGRIAGLEREAAFHKAAAEHYRKNVEHLQKRAEEIEARASEYGRQIAALENENRLIKAENDRLNSLVSKIPGLSVQEC